MSSTHYPNGTKIPAWKRALKFTGKVAGGTVVALVTATLFSIIVFGGAVAGILNGVKADSAASETTDEPEITEDVIGEPEFFEEDTAVGGPADEEATIVLEASATGPATVTWSEPGSFGNTEVLPDGGPWSLEIPDGDPYGFYNVMVQSDDYENQHDLSCKITVDGEVPVDGESQATGDAAIADCNKAMLD